MANEERPPATPHSPKDLVPMGERGLQLNTLEDIHRFAQYVSQSGMAPRDMSSPSQILVAIQMGAELGLPPMASIQNIAVINGRPSIRGDAALAVCQMHPDFLDIDEEFDDATQTATCKVYTKKRGMERPVVRTWSRKDNEAAGLEGGNVHKKFPKRMKQMRARSWALRDTFPGALKGLLTAEEAQELPPRMVENENDEPPKTGKMDALYANVKRVEPETTPEPVAKPSQSAVEATLRPEPLRPADVRGDLPPDYQGDEHDAEDPPFDAEPQGREPGSDDDVGEPEPFFEECAPATDEQKARIVALKAEKKVAPKQFANLMVDAGSEDAQVATLTTEQPDAVIARLLKLKS